jgi:hypothetical protein
MKTVLSTETKDFLDRHISSDDELQILLLLHSQPQKRWTAMEVGEAVRMEPLSAARHLMDLHKKGLVRHHEQSGALYDFQYRLYIEAEEDQVYELSKAFETASWVISDYISKRRRTG